MKISTYLSIGDSIGIVSTARKITKNELLPAIKLLEEWGLKPVLGNSIGAEENQFAGTDNLRAADFQQMLDDPNIKAIWCARGGYGTVRIIDQLDFSKFKKSPKWIIGYSDITVLHSHIHNFGIETIHANMCMEIGIKTEATRNSIKTVLFGEKHQVSFASELPTLNRNGIAKGKLVGGNLSLLYSLIGSPSAIDSSGKILFIEDLDEYLYHIDRMMINLKRSGMLQDLNGLIVGGMSDMRDNAIPFGKTAEEIVLDAVKEYNYPVCFNFPAGHIDDNRALIMGREVQLTVDNTITLDF